MSVLLSFIYLDILETPLWLDNLIFVEIAPDETDDDSPLSFYLNESGFGDMPMLKNMGSTIVFLIIYLALGALLLILKLLGAIWSL